MYDKKAVEKYRLSHKDKKREVQKRYGQKNYWYYRERNWKRQGVDMNGQLFESMFMSQGKACAICSDPIDHKAHVDHEHDTGRIRGLLCGLCNKGLGQFKDDVTRLASAVKYLNERKR